MDIAKILFLLMINQTHDFDHRLLSCCKCGISVRDYKIVGKVYGCGDKGVN